MIFGKISARAFDSIILGAVCAIFFISSVALYVSGPDIFNSPDELANHFFSVEFAKNNNLYSFDALNLSVGDLLHPRSMISVGGRISPVSFLGMPLLYGLIAKFFGSETIIIYTSVFAIAAIFCWKRIVEILFNRRIALISAIMLAFHPAWWYYASRGMMHNVLFASFLIFSAYFLLARPFKNRFEAINAIVSGILLGFAVFVRSSEIGWIVLSLVAVFWFFRKHINFKNIILFIVSFTIALAPIFIFNKSLYGNSLTFGYTFQNDSNFTQNGEIVLEPSEQPQAENISTENKGGIIKSILPFGFHPRAMLRNFSAYGLEMFWWLTALSIIGAPLFYFWRYTDPKIKALNNSYKAIFIISGVWLVTVYGSWAIFDNPDPKAVTIINSYVRYWLPAFILTTPFAALAIDWIADKARTKSAKAIATAILILICSVLSIRAVFWSKHDGILKVRENLIRYAQIRDEIFEITEPQSIIVTDRADKFLFPERHVVVPLRDEKTYKALPSLVLRRPVYYYGLTLPETDLVHLNDVILDPLGLRIHIVQTFDAESLYVIFQKI